MVATARNVDRSLDLARQWDGDYTDICDPRVEDPARSDVIRDRGAEVRGRRDLRGAR